MISYNRSRVILKNSKILVGDEIIKSDNCLNRVVSENIFTKVNNPAGNNAAFDGYAIASKDTNDINREKGKLFKIIGLVAAGDKPTKKRKEKFSKFLDGIQPIFKHVPPRDPLDSMHAVLKPNWDSLIAQTYPPGPPPIIVTSNFSDI